jgi:amino acid permease
VLLPSDTDRKPITSITSHLLPSVTYLLNLAAFVTQLCSIYNYETYFQKLLQSFSSEERPLMTGMYVIVFTVLEPHTFDRLVGREM